MREHVLTTDTIYSTILLIWILFEDGLLVLQERKNKILERCEALAKDVNGQIILQETLLDEVSNGIYAEMWLSVTDDNISNNLQVVNLVEAPLPVLGKFSESFLVLPKDLLTMVIHLIIDMRVTTSESDSIFSTQKNTFLYLQGQLHHYYFDSTLNRFPSRCCLHSLCKQLHHGGFY